MVLIIGGAYQGKLDFAKSAFGLSESDVFTCTGGEIDFSRRCIDRIEEFTLWCVQSGVIPFKDTARPETSVPAGSSGGTAFSFARISPPGWCPWGRKCGRGGR